MNTPNVFSYILRYFLYILLQVVFLKNVALFEVAFCFAYVALLLTLPFEIDRVVQLLIGFSVGLLIDVFYDTLGIHAAACTLMMYFRKYPSQLLSPRGGYESGVVPSVQELGVQWFTAYSLPLIFVHHLALFFIEASNTQIFFTTLGRAFASTVFTFFVIILLQYLFHVERRKRAY